MIIQFVYAFLFSLAYSSVVGAFDFDDCATNARLLMNASEEAESAQRGYKTAKSVYESACSTYGYDRDNSYACGPYGYHRSSLDSAKRKLDSKAREVSDYVSRVNTGCESMSPTRFNAMSILAQELQNTKQALTNCQQGSSK